MAVPVTSSGKKGKVKIGTSTPVGLSITQWKVTEKLDELDETTAEDNGYEVTGTGVIGLTITLTITYFITQGPFATLTRGAVFSNMKLYTYHDGSDLGPFWDIPNSVITSVEMTSEVRGRITLAVTCRSRGAYTPPVS